ncbi:Rv3235 family protein [Gordonia aurantiaca]|uniref:Rv3235 family protein n=1 Tax=Gordonia sp. B21 TaxID=3151852 RepID=UPI00326340D5
MQPLITAPAESASAPGPDTPTESGAESVVRTPRVRVRPAPAYEPGGSGPVVYPLRRTSGVGTLRVRHLPDEGSAPSRKVLAAAVEARRFTIATSRLLFEVIDRRRGTAHLHDTVAPALVDQVAALVRHDAFRVAEPVGPPSSGPVRTSAPGTVLQRVHVQLCDTSAAEVFGSYTSGGRIRAFAGRIERKPCRTRVTVIPGTARPALGRVEYRWQLVALEFH